MNTNALLVVSAAVLAFIVSAPLARRIARGRLMDVPNERSLHERPTPRGGGLAILAGFAVALLVLGVAGLLPPAWPWLLGAAALVAAVSLADDLSHVHPVLRVAVHAMAAGLLLPAAGPVVTLTVPGVTLQLLAPLGAIFVVLFVTWMVNLYNFMDGMDGFAGGMAVFGFVAYGLLGALGGHWAFAGVSFAVAAASGGFLASNFPPARVFMGDVGAATLGLLAAGLGLMAEHGRVFPLWVAVIVFSPFIMDASVTLVRRIMRGERVWEAHRSHYYQRLVRLGWGHRRTVLAEYVLMAACAASALVAPRLGLDLQLGLCAWWLLAYTCLALAVHHLEARA